MHYPTDPEFPVGDEDDPYLERIAGDRIRPIFIMGQHRSGTTFLYDCIARCFPVASLELYHLFYFDSLLHDHEQGKSASRRAHLNQVFRALGITDRKIDEVRVIDTMVEEYGWLLHRFTGALHVTDDNAPKLELLCRKLATIDSPVYKAVLLKNPWDIGNSGIIRQHFPQALFIFITREFERIQSSLEHALIALLSGPQPFQTMLIDRWNYPGGRIGKSLFMGLWAFLRRLRAVMGNRLFLRLSRPFIRRQVQSQIKAYNRDLHDLPTHSAMEISYGELTRDPEAMMEKISAFLDLPITGDPAAIEVSTRELPDLYTKNKVPRTINPAS